ncbi:hypothetical protein [Cellulomonas soli]
MMRTADASLAATMALSPREWAIATQIGLLAVMAFRIPGVRSTLPTLVRQLVSAAILVPLVALAGWVALLVIGASRVGLWNMNLLKDTVIWFLTSAFATLFAAVKAGKTDGYFWTATKQAVGAAVFLQYAMNMHSFNYFVELVLQAALLLFGVMLAYTSRKEEYRGAHTLLLGIYGLLIIVVVTFTVRGIIHGWDGIDASQTVLSLALSVWLPLGVLPFIWVFAVAMAYEVLLKRMSKPVFGLRAPRLTLAATIATLGPDLRAVNDLPRHPSDLRAIASATSWSATREAVRVYRHRRARKRDEAGLAARRLARLAGARGTDPAGRQLDQREIKETRDALHWLATCHMGHHRNRGAYRADLMEVLGDFTKQGLPPEHGIQMAVASGGSSWYAWRRTPSDLVLGIGAVEAPPDQWFYAAMHPPHGRPSLESGWERTLSTAPDWSS